MHMRNDGALPSLPDYIAATMARTGMSPAELARRAGAGSSQVSRWLAGKNRPDTDQLRLIAKALDVRLLDLVVIAGHLTAEEAGLDVPPTRPDPPEWTREAVLNLALTQFTPTSAVLVRSVMEYCWAADDGLTPDGDPKLSIGARLGVKAAQRELNVGQATTERAGPSRRRRSATSRAPSAAQAPRV